MDTNAMCFVVTFILIAVVVARQYGASKKTVLAIVIVAAVTLVSIFVFVLSYVFFGVDKDAKKPVLKKVSQPLLYALPTPQPQPKPKYQPPPEPAKPPPQPKSKSKKKMSIGKFIKTKIVDKVSSTFKDIKIEKKQVVPLLRQFPMQFRIQQSRKSSKKSTPQPKPYPQPNNQNFQNPYALCTLTSPIGDIKRIPFPNNISLLEFKNLHPDINTSEVDVYDATFYCPPPAPPPYPQAFRIGMPNGGDYLLYNTTYNLPNYLEVMQGGIGNCVLDSLLACMAYTNAPALKSRIIPDPNTQHIYYIVWTDPRQNSPKPFLIKLSSLIPLDKGRDWLYDKLPYDSVTNKPIMWSYLLLKSYVCATVILKDFLLFSIPGAIGYQTMEGIYFTPLQKALIGAPTTEYIYEIAQLKSMLRNINDQRFYIQAAVDDRKVPPTSDRYIWSSYGNIPIVCIYSQHKLENVFIARHAYTVFEYNEADKIVKIRNPWGECIIPQGTGDPRFGTQLLYKNGVMSVHEDDIVNLMYFVYSKRDKI